MRNLVRLRQNRSTGLLQDLSASHVGYFDSVVSVFDARTYGSEVGLVGVQVGDGIFETILNGTENL